MELKYSFHAFAVGDLSYREGRIDRASTLSDDYPGKNLYPFLAAFTHKGVNLDGVSNVEIGDFFLQLLLLDFPDDVHDLYWGREGSVLRNLFNWESGGREGYTMPI